MATKQTTTTTKKVTKKRVVKVEAVGEAHINATFNNIIISLTNTSGQVISWASAGKMGFRGRGFGTLKTPADYSRVLPQVLALGQSKSHQFLMPYVPIKVARRLSNTNASRLAPTNLLWPIVRNNAIREWLFG